MSVARALAWNTGVQVLGKVVSTAFGVAIVGLMTRYLGTEGFGAYSTGNAFLQIFALFIDLGLNVTLVAMLGERAGDTAYERRCSSAIFTLRLVMALVTFGFLAPAAAFLFPYPLVTKLAIVVLSGSFLFPVLNQIVIGVEQRHMKMHTAAIAENLGRAVLLIGLLASRQLGWGLLAIMAFVTIASAVNFFMNLFAARRYGSFAWNWDPAFWKIALKRSWPIGLSIMFGLIYFKADTLILSLVRPQAEVGIYGAAYRVLEILITIPFMYAGVLLPLLSKAWATQNRERFAQLISRSIDVTSLLIAPLIAATLVLGPRIMTLVAGPEFAESGEILRVLILAIGVIYFNTVFSHAIVAIDAQRKMLPVYIAVAVVILAGYVLFIPAYGMLAAAWLTVLSELLVGLGSLIISYRTAPFTFQPKTTLAATAAAIVMGLVVQQMITQPIYAPIAAGAVVYVALAYLFGGVSKATLKEIFAAKKENVPLEPLT